MNDIDVISWLNKRQYVKCAFSRFTFSHVRGPFMASNSLLEAQITAALAVLRTARCDGHPELVDGCQHHLDALLDRLAAELVAV